VVPLGAIYDVNVTANTSQAVAYEHWYFSVELLSSLNLQERRLEILFDG
jgi:hypothetical protein